MRYWAYFAGKLVVAAAPLYGLLRFLVWAYPAARHRDTVLDLGRASQDFSSGLALLVWFLISAGTLYAIVWDQRRRCRVCLRRLRMPIQTGSRGLMLQFGPPAIESICPYGHGTLREDGEPSGLSPSEWTPHSDNVWDELCAPGKDSSQDQ